MTGHGDHVRINQDHWESNAPNYAAVAPAQWDAEPRWGIFGLPEHEARLLPDVAGLDVEELGCVPGPSSSSSGTRRCSWCARPEKTTCRPPTGSFDRSAPLHRFEWPDQSSVEFHVSHGDMIRLLRVSGFEVEDLIDLYAPEGATTRCGFVDADWASRWPTEEVWVARKRWPSVSRGSW